MAAALAAGWMLVFAAGASTATVDLEPYLRRDSYERVKISPDGAYFAITVPMEDRTVLAVVRREDLQPTAKVAGGVGSEVDDFWWANNERVVVSMAHRYGSRDQPGVIGELHAVNADGSYAKLLASPYGLQESNPLVSHLRYELEGSVFMLDPMPTERNFILVQSVAQTSDPVSQIERLDLYTRRRTHLASGPLPYASFTTDAAGQVRFAHGVGRDNSNKLYYREDDKAKWRLVHDEATAKVRAFARGFTPDGRLAYLQMEHRQGPDSLGTWDPETGEYTELLRDEVVEPLHIIHDLDGRTPIGAAYMTDRVRYRFFDEQAPTARLYRMLEKAFEGDALRITSVTADGREALVHVYSDRNNGDYFLFDTVSRSAERVASRRSWFRPSQVPHSRFVGFKARDGLELHGYLTEPKDGAEGPRPMVVLPHGGPFGVQDRWGFDDDAQVLAEAGYAVLRVNYRGSGGYGRAHQLAGAQEWGGAMQDDLADATRWAIDQGIADPRRICIYGASYGGYAALMGVAKDPDLYRCAAGYVGVYDLPMMHRDASRRGRVGRTWALDWMGAREELEQLSPVNLADRIKVPVFLAAGGADERAPIAHSRQMEKALQKAGVPVETLYYPTEGHGFYTMEHRREFYARLLAFLSRHLGGKPAS